jgi:hypothetical protein
MAYSFQSIKKHLISVPLLTRCSPLFRESAHQPYIALILNSRLTTGANTSLLPVLRVFVARCITRTTNHPTPQPTFKYINENAGASLLRHMRHLRHPSYDSIFYSPNMTVREFHVHLNPPQNFPLKQPQSPGQP